MASRRASALTEEDRDLIARSLRAAVFGSYFPDWEIDTLTAFTSEELSNVSAAWPEAVAVASWTDDPDQTQFVAVNNVLDSLIGYPHGEWDRLQVDLGGADEARLAELVNVWRGGPVDGRADANE
jgi:hypothetical protein